LDNAIANFALMITNEIINFFRANRTMDWLDHFQYYAEMLGKSNRNKRVPAQRLQRFHSEFFPAEKQDGIEEDCVSKRPCVR
jgi:hypothetical protein